MTEKLANALSLFGEAQRAARVTVERPHYPPEDLGNGVRVTTIQLKSPPVCTHLIYSTVQKS